LFNPEPAATAALPKGHSVAAGSGLNDRVLMDASTGTHPGLPVYC